MPNLRIDVIRQELKWRYEEIEKLESESEARSIYGKVPYGLEESIEHFMHFLITEPVTKSYLLELSNYYSDPIIASELKEIGERIASLIYQIAEEVKKAGFFNSDFKKAFNERYQGLNNIFSIPNPEVVDDQLSIEMYIEGFDLNRGKSEIIIEYYESIFDTFSKLFRFAEERHEKYNFATVDRLMFKELMPLWSKYTATYTLQPNFNGVKALWELLVPYSVSNYMLLSGMSHEDFGAFVDNSIRAAKISGGPTATLDHFKYARILYHTIDKYLYSTQSKYYLIDRLITYCIWIKRDKILSFGSKQKEIEISKILEEFIFQQGYFPIVRAKFSKGEPDLLIISDNNVNKYNSIVIEIKQAIDRSYGYSDLVADMGQASDYLNIVKGIKPEIADAVHLLIFYNGPNRLIIDESVNIPKNTIVKFIYVGNASPSRLKSKLIAEK